MISYNLLLMTIIIVFIIDISGIIQSIEKGLNKILGSKYCKVPKPFSCSLCMTFWIGLAYIISIGKFTIEYVCLVAIFSYATQFIVSIFYLIGDIISKLINYLDGLF